MKKLVVLVSAVVFSASVAGAQNLFDMLKGVASQTSLSSVVSAVSNGINAIIPSSVDLAGAWTYNGVAVGVKSDNALTKIAANTAMGTVESKIDNALSKVGIKPGAATLTFGSDYSFSFKVGKINIPGTWEQKDDKVTIKFGKLLKFITLDGIVKSATGGCEILFDVDKYVAFAQKVISVLGSGEGTVSTLLNAVDGVDAGFKLAK